jgi:glycosyltransferase involved in cell wall biosynthesis
MRVALDVSPVKTGHAVRGIGFYTKRLTAALKKIDKKNKYILIEDSKFIIHDSEFDLVHYPYFDFFFLTLPVFKKTKTIVTIHDVIPLVFPEHFPPGIKGKIKFQIQKFSLKSVPAVITDSQNSKKDIVKFLGVPEEKTHVVYLAPGSEFKPLDRFEMMHHRIISKYRLPEKFALYVGDINWNKNIPGLVKACRRVDIPLVIVGKQAGETNIDRSHLENRDLAWLQDYCSRQPSVVLTGFVPTNDLVAIYNLATVYVQPSFYEGFGLPVLEAMACGCPVVATDTSSIPEITGNAAILVDPTNVENLALCIKGVFDDIGMQKELSHKGLAQAKRFSWEKTARGTISVYKKVSG